MRLWLHLFIMFLVIWLPVQAQDTSGSSPEQRFEAEKRARLRSAVQVYVRMAKSKIERGWHPNGLSNLSTAVVKISLDGSGKVTDTAVLRSSKSESYDQSITDLVQSVKLDPLPLGLSGLDLFLTFMSDSTMNMIEFAEVPEADTYYVALVDGVFSHTGAFYVGQRPMAIPYGSPTPSPMPRIGAGAGHGSAPGPAPAPIATSSGASGGGQPSPSPISGGGAPHVGGGSGPVSGIWMRATHGGGGGGPAIAVAPKVPRPQGGGGGEGIKGNPDANNNERGRPSASAQADINFWPYMAIMQRSIKRAWLPPKGYEGRVVRVVFKIHKDGTMSNLRLDHSSGVAIADQAALKAIENAAPFRPLPSGAQDDVDIQYTFDVNGFGGRAVMRSF